MTLTVCFCLRRVCIFFSCCWHMSGTCIPFSKRSFATSVRAPSHRPSLTAQISNHALNHASAFLMSTEYSNPWNLGSRGHVLIPCKRASLLILGSLSGFLDFQYGLNTVCVAYWKSALEKNRKFDVKLNTGINLHQSFFTLLQSIIIRTQRSFRKASIACSLHQTELIAVVT